MDARIDPATKPLYRATQVIWYLLGLLEFILLFRFALRLLGANPASFSEFIYAISYPFVAPFEAVFNTTSIGGSVFDWTTLLAMFVYWIVAAGIVKLLLVGRPLSTLEAAARLSTQE